MFESMVQGWFEESDEYGDFVTSLLAGDLKAMNYYMQRVTIETFSYFDTGKGKFGDEPERFYHGFVLGLLVDLRREYVITSNRESGWQVGVSGAWRELEARPPLPALLVDAHQGQPCSLCWFDSQQGHVQLSQKHGWSS